MTAVEPPVFEPAEAGPPLLRVTEPATGRLLVDLEVDGFERVAGMAARARLAQPEWEAMGFDGRARVLRRMQRWLLDNDRRVVQTLVSESGKAHEDALLVELGYVASALGWWAAKAPKLLADEKVRSLSPVLLGRRMRVSYRPFGVVGVIGPWNFPLLNSFGDCVPALAAGNAVILKPSEYTPLTSLLMAEGMASCGAPEDVFAVAVGAAETGEAVVDATDMVMFTGSTATGRKVMERASRTLTPVSLELGGKDPMIVLADADVDRAANAAVYGSMQNSGQACLSIERVYVEAGAYEPFVAAVTDKVRALRQGPPAGPGSIDVGAMAFPEQVDVVDAHVRQALDAGARALTGGRRGAGPGHFYEPTVLVDVDHSMDALRAETFGPTLPIVRVADAGEAVRLANDSPFGLAASVWSGDSARGEQVARAVEAGAVCVNDVLVNYFALELPMGGWKGSGLGVRHGAAGIRKYCRQQSVLTTAKWWPLRNELHWMPYQRWKTRLVGETIKTLYGRLSRR